MINCPLDRASNAFSVTEDASETDLRTLIARLKAHATPSHRRSLLQLAITFGAFLALWLAMCFSLDHSYAITLLLAVPTAGFLVRLFVIQHDCGHGSYFRSRRANDLVH